MLYEWRTYLAIPGKAGAVVRHLEATNGCFERLGLPTLGFWSEEFGAPGRLSFAWMFEGLEARAAHLAALREDPGWIEFAAAEKERDGAAFDHVESVLWQPVPYSPTPQANARVVELRMYDAMPGRLPDLHARFEQHTLTLFERHGMQNCGYWTEYFGHSNRLVYLLGYESLAQREQAWRAFSADPEWQKARAESEQDGPLIAQHSARIMRRLRFSRA